MAGLFSCRWICYLDKTIHRHGMDAKCGFLNNNQQTLRLWISPILYSSNLFVRMDCWMKCQTCLFTKLRHETMLFGTFTSSLAVRSKYYSLQSIESHFSQHNDPARHIDGLKSRSQTEDELQTSSVSSSFFCQCYLWTYIVKPSFKTAMFFFIISTLFLCLLEFSSTLLFQETFHHSVLRPSIYWANTIMLCSTLV